MTRPDSCPELYHTRAYSTYRHWITGGYFNLIFTSSLSHLHQLGMLDLAVIQGDGITAAAKKGDDNIGFNGHKMVKANKVVAFCDRNFNVIAPFVTATSNHNVLPLICGALSRLLSLAKILRFELHGAHDR